MRDNPFDFFPPSIAALEEFADRVKRLLRGQAPKLTNYDHVMWNTFRLSGVNLRLGWGGKQQATFNSPVLFDTTKCHWNYNTNCQKGASVVER